MSADTTAHAQMAITDTYRGSLRPKRLYSSYTVCHIHCVSFFFLPCFSPPVTETIFARENGTCETHTQDRHSLQGAATFHLSCYVGKCSSAFSTRAFGFYIFLVQHRDDFLCPPLNDSVAATLGDEFVRSTSRKTVSVQYVRLYIFWHYSIAQSVSKDHLTWPILCMVCSPALCWPYELN